MSTFAFKPVTRTGFMLAPAYPEKWQSTRLRFLCDLNPSKKQIADLDPSTSVSFVPMEKVSEAGVMNLEDVRPIDSVSNGYTFFADGDVLVAKITPCFENGKGAECKGLTNGFGFGTTEFHVLRSKHLDSRFLFYITASDPFRTIGATEMSGAAGQKRVPESFLQNLITPLPPLSTQRRIAAYLDRETAQIDALVAEKETLLGLLEEKRASLISHAVTRGLDPKTKLKPSGIPWLGDVPDHWDLVPLSSVISYLSYGFTNPMPSFHDGEGVPLLTANDIGEGIVKFETARKTTREAFSGLTGKCRPLKNDILITKDGTLGRIAVSDGTECCINQSVALLRINPTKANIRFVAIALTASAYQDRMIFEAGGTTIKHIYITRLAKMTIALPPKNEQDALVTYGMQSLATIDSLLGSVKLSITLLREKRSSLISAAVTGEMAVS